MEESGFVLPTELRLLRETVRRFIQKEVIPAELSIDPDATDLPADVTERLRAKAREAGLWCLASPAKYGGAELSIFAQVIVAEEASQHRIGAYHPAAGAFGYDPPNIIFAGTEEQIQKYAVPQIQQGTKAFMAISEPSGGSDPAGSIQTRAVRQANGWVLNGSKIWISGGDKGKYGVVFARTDTEGDQHRNITAFLVEQGSPGFEWRYIPVIRPYYPTELFFTDCYIPDSQRLGEVGAGFTLANAWLTKGRIPYAASCIGTAVAALRMAVEYANQRYTFGKPLATRQAIQWMIADSETEIRSARWLTWEAAWKADRGEDYRVESSMCKLVASEAAGRVVDRVMQIFGGMGMAKELPLERWYRELRVKRVGEGPSEIHRMVISRALLKGYTRAGGEV